MLERNPAPSRGGLAGLSIFSGAEERPPLAEEESSPFKERFFKLMLCLAIIFVFGSLLSATHRVSSLEHAEKTMILSYFADRLRSNPCLELHTLGRVGLGLLMQQDRFCKRSKFCLF
jgi:hypothetical protein